MKNIKKILSFLLVLSLCFTLAISLTSCKDTGDDNGDGDNTDDNKISYTVTVKDKDGKAVSGVKLMISDSSSVFENKETGTDGKATLKLDAENVSLGVMITSVPSGYEKPTPISGVFHAVFGNKKDIIIEIDKPTTETVTYTVKVVDQNGDAVVGAELQICHTVCVQCDLTDSNGETKKELSSSVSSGTLKVGILNLPEGYTIPEATVEGGYHATIAPSETEITVEVIKN